MKEKYYMNYQGSIEENFNKYVGKPGLFGMCEDFCGRINNNKFWFYKRSAFRKNSFRIVLYGEVLDNKVCFSYKKFPFLIPMVLLFDLFFLAFLFIFALYPFIMTGSCPIDTDSILLFIIVPAIITFLTFRYPKKEKEALYTHLQQICGQDVQ